MPIHGLTTEADFVPARGLIRFGKLRKGEPKGHNKPGRDLNYFRPDFLPEHEDLLPAFQKLFGEKPTEFDIALIGNTTQKVFMTYNESWSATTMLHRCDGQWQSRYYDRKTQSYVSARKSCAKDPDYDCGCKPIGRLTFMIPAFNEAVGTVGAFTLETHSIQDIQQIFNQLRFLQEALGNLNFVQVSLGRANREGSYKDASGKRKKRTFSLLYLKYRTEDIQNHLLPMPDANAPSLPAPGQLPSTTKPAASAPSQTNDGNYMQFLEEEQSWAENGRPPSSSKANVDIAQWISDKAPILNKGEVLAALQTLPDNHGLSQPEFLAHIICHWFNGQDIDRKIVEDITNACLGNEYLQAVWDAISQTLYSAMNNPMEETHDHTEQAELI